MTLECELMAFFLFKLYDLIFLAVFYESPEPTESKLPTREFI